MTKAGATGQVFIRFSFFELFAFLFLSFVMSECFTLSGSNFSFARNVHQI